MKRFAEIVYAIAPVGGAVYGMAEHKSYGMGLFICGVIGGVLGFIAGTLLILVSAVLMCFLYSFKPFDPKKSQNRGL